MRVHGEATGKGARTQAVALAIKALEGKPKADRTAEDEAERTRLYGDLEESTRYLIEHRARGFLRKRQVPLRGRPDILDELVAAGSASLFEGIRRWDPSRASFVTAFHFTLLAEMSKAFYVTTSCVSIPPSIMEQAKRVERVRPGFMARACRPLRFDSLPKHGSIAGSGIVSEDVLVDPSSGEAAESIDHGERVAELFDMLDELPGKCGEVLRLRYLSGEEDPVPFATVAEEVGVSKQRIQQIEKRALNLLRRRVAETGRLV